MTKCFLQIYNQVRGVLEETSGGARGKYIKVRPGFQTNHNTTGN